MEKKAKKRLIRNDGYQPSSPNIYGCKSRSAARGYKPKPGSKPKKPTSGTDVTTDRK